MRQALAARSQPEERRFGWLDQSKTELGDKGLKLGGHWGETHRQLFRIIIFGWLPQYQTCCRQNHCKHVQSCFWVSVVGLAFQNQIVVAPVSLFLIWCEV